MGHVVQDATKTVKNGAHLLVPLQALPEWSLAQSSPRNCTAEYSFQSCIKNSSRLRQRHDTLDMMCVCVSMASCHQPAWCALPMAPSATTCAANLPASTAPSILPRNFWLVQSPARVKFEIGVAWAYHSGQGSKAMQSSPPMDKWIKKRSK